jgi:hypothetical protein
MMDDIERQLLEAGHLEPRGHLRAQVLAATRPLVRGDCHVLDRVWFSRTWRAAAIVTVIVLFGTDVLVRPPAPAAFQPSAAAVETARAVESAAREVGLTPDLAADVGAQTLAAPSRPSQPEMETDSLFEESAR